MGVERKTPLVFGFEGANVVLVGGTWSSDSCSVCSFTWKMGVRRYILESIEGGVVRRMVRVGFVGNCPRRKLCRGVDIWYFGVSSGVGVGVGGFCCCCCCCFCCCSTSLTAEAISSSLGGGADLDGALVNAGRGVRFCDVEVYLVD